MNNDLVGFVIGLLLLALLVATTALPIIALVVSIRTRIRLKQTVAQLESQQPSTITQTAKSLSDLVQQLTMRVARLEAMVSERTGTPAAAEDQQPQPRQIEPPVTPPPPSPPPQPAPVPHSMPPPIATPHIDAQKLESIIGGRWLGWAAVALIVFATSFFLKYAFENRWIGELGRVAIGVAAGLALTTLGYRYHQRNWRVFSQILTAGGIGLLYLSAYASFGFYQLAPQRAAFVYMTILIIEAAGLALLYNAPAIAVMALIGGFLTPVLLHSDRDQHRILFGYIFALDLATLSFLKRWWGMKLIAFAGTHFLFWLWYLENYESPKLGAVMTFQTAVFLAFLLAHVAGRLFAKEPIALDDAKALIDDPSQLVTRLEKFSLLIANPFVFFATAYGLLDSDYHAWMGTVAVVMALVHAGVAKLLLDRGATTRTEFILLIGISLAFITLAIPLQLDANCITIGWAVEGLIILWAGVEIRSALVRSVGQGAFSLAVLKLMFDDTSFFRPMFTPVLNKYFGSSLFVTACLFAGAFVYQRLGARKQVSARVFQLVLLMGAIITLWFVLTVETYTYFAARADQLSDFEEIRRERWLGQMALSVLWSVYAAVLMAVGFFRRAPAVRWASLSLFALTVIKVMLVDVSVLEQLYRIIAFLVLGLLLLLVAWGYHRVVRAKETPS